MIPIIISQILVALITIYSLCCVARILLIWLPGKYTNKASRFLQAISDPYLNLFRNLRWFRSGAFDFSPILALTLLAVASSMISYLGTTRIITLGIVIGIIIAGIWSAIAFILSFFLVCSIIRIIAFLARWNSLHPLWVVVDSLLNPILYFINKIIYRKSFVNYLRGLITGLAVLAILRFGGGILFDFLIHNLQRL